VSGRLHCGQRYLDSNHGPLVADFLVRAAESSILGSGPRGAINSRIQKVLEPLPALLRGSSGHCDGHFRPSETDKAQHVNELVLLYMCASAQNMPPHHGMCSRLQARRRASSSTDQAPFFNPGLSVSDHLWEHCVWLRSGIGMAIAFQSFQNIFVSV
jgi:hypothetical protein